MQTQSIFIRDGFWLSSYEPYDMPGAFCSTRFKIIPIDGGNVPKNGSYKGFVLANETLRLVKGGEYMGGPLINHSMRDFKIDFDNRFHDEYKSGLIRGYKGKRALAYGVYARRSQEWLDGYRAGRQAKQDLR